MKLNPEPVNGRHVLNASWTLWYDRPSTTPATYGEQTTKVMSFDTVEDFWKSPR